MFSALGRIAYNTKREKINRHKKDKTYKAIMVGYYYNHTRDMYKLYNSDTKRVVISRDVNWAEWKTVDPA